MAITFCSDPRVFPAAIGRGADLQFALTPGCATTR